MRLVLQSAAMLLLALTPLPLGTTSAADAMADVSYVRVSEEPDPTAPVAGRFGAYPRFHAVAPLPGVSGGWQFLVFPLSNQGIEAFEGLLRLRVPELGYDVGFPDTMPSGLDPVIMSAYLGFRIPEDAPSSIHVELWWESNGERVGDAWSRTLSVHGQNPCDGGIRTLMESGGDKNIVSGLERPMYALVFCNASTEWANVTVDLFDTRTGRPLVSGFERGLVTAGRAVFAGDVEASLAQRATVPPDYFAIIWFSLEDASAPQEIHPVAHAHWSDGAAEMRTGLDPVTFAVGID